MSEEELAIRKDQLSKILDQVKDPKTQVVKSKQKSIYLQTRSNRGSKFRGVSKNGKKWQVTSSFNLYTFNIGDDSQRNCQKVHGSNQFRIEGCQALRQIRSHHPGLPGNNM